MTPPRDWANIVFSEDVDVASATVDAAAVVVTSRGCCSCSSLFSAAVPSNIDTEAKRRPTLLTIPSISLPSLPDFVFMIFVSSLQRDDFAVTGTLCGLKALIPVGNVKKNKKRTANKIGRCEQDFNISMEGFNIIQLLKLLKM